MGTSIIADKPHATALDRLINSFSEIGAGVMGAFDPDPDPNPNLIAMPVTSKAIMEDGKLLKDTSTPEYAEHCRQGHPYDPGCLICNQGYMRAKQVCSQGLRAQQEGPELYEAARRLQHRHPVLQ